MPEPVLVSSHSNQVKIECSSISALSYNHFFSITDGQPSSPPPTASHNGTTWTITIECGRKASREVAEAFNQACLGANSGGSSAQHEFAGSGGSGGTPDELNFCFGMNATFSSETMVATAVLYFGQGSYGTTNNWWLGGNTLLNVGKPVLELISSNQVVDLLQVSGSVSSFTLG